MVRFITFEGGDGSGKTTQLKRLEAWLKSQGRRCVVTREPGGTALGQTLRKVLLEVGETPVVPAAELLLYLADRAQHVQEVIRPALLRGDVVLCDRYTDSTLAYQGYGRGIDLAVLRQQNAIANGGLAPDLTLLFDCPVEVGLGRTVRRQTEAGAAANAEDRFEREHKQFHEKLRAGFLEMAKAEPKRFRVIDATQSIEAIAEQVRTIVERELTP
ncbi:MAG: dTMP kinase [Deltaproteobacteria bacterium]|nr:dTMP kinase [Deltaproteobacteria bacterium]